MCRSRKELDKNIAMEECEAYNNSPYNGNTSTTSGTEQQVEPDHDYEVIV